MHASLPIFLIYIDNQFFFTGAGLLAELGAVSMGSSSHDNGSVENGRNLSRTHRESVPGATRIGKVPGKPVPWVW